MAEAEHRRFEERVLIVAPTRKDAALSAAFLGDEGVACVVCAGVSDVCREIEVGAGAVILNEEALEPDAFDALCEVVGRQPPWSDLPILVLTRSGADSDVAIHSVQSLGNVTLLERPVRVAALISAVRSALRARRKQYEVREQIAEVRRVAESLADADRRKNEFLAMLGHELRNPLAPIRNANYTLRFLGSRDRNVEWVREVVDRQLTHLTRLVDDLLDVSRITRGKIALQLDPVELRTVIAGAVETSRPSIDARGHALVVSVPDESLVVNGDLTRLTQVVSNLLNNAAKFTDRGGHIGVRAAREGDVAVVAVRDDGIGIPPDLLARVFDLFVQADRTLDRSQGGLGIGLTLARTLVEMHGGTLQAFSDGLGRGSTFEMRLPLAPIVGSKPRADLAEPCAAGVPRRVLLVEDQVDAADALARVLESAGHDVRVVHDGAQALEAARAHRPEVVLLDIGLPGLDGHAIARRLRHDELVRHARLVAISGFANEEDRRLSSEAGFDEHLVKPTEPEIILALVASIGADGKGSRRL
jgi:signal transduction histidine kinase/ActR/RegA family two-component response regulator